MKKTAHILFIFFSLSIFVSGFSQDLNKQNQRDSLNLKFKKDSAHIYRFKVLRPFVSLDNRKSFLRSAPVDVKGFQLGMIIKEKHTVGFGIYSLQNSSRHVITDKNEHKIAAKRTLNLNYLTLFYQYVIADRRYFELDVPLEVGLGGYRVLLEDTIARKVLSDNRGGVLLTGGGVNIVLKPFKWVGLSGTLGYRIALEKNPNLNFNGLYYSYGLWIDLRQIYRDIKFYGFTRKKHRQRMLALS